MTATDWLKMGGSVGCLIGIAVVQNPGKGAPSRKN